MLWIETQRTYALLELNNERKPQRSVSESFFICSGTRRVLATCFFFSDIELARGISHFYPWNFQQLQTVPFICFLVLSFFNNVLTSVLDSFIWKYPRTLSPVSLSIYLWSKIFLSIPSEIIKHLWVKQEWVFNVYDRSAWYAGSYLSQTSFLSWLCFTSSCAILMAKTNTHLFTCS